MGKSMMKYLCWSNAVPLAASRVATTCRAVFSRPLVSFGSHLGISKAAGRGKTFDEYAICKKQAPTSMSCTLDRSLLTDSLKSAFSQHVQDCDGRHLRLADFAILDLREIVGGMPATFDMGVVVVVHKGLPILIHGQTFIEPCLGLSDIKRAGGDAVVTITDETGLAKDGQTLGISGKSLVGVAAPPGSRCVLEGSVVGRRGLWCFVGGSPACRGLSAG